MAISWTVIDDDEKDKNKNNVTGGDFIPIENSSISYSVIEDNVDQTPSQQASQENKAFNSPTQTEEVKQETKKVGVFQQIGDTIRNVWDKLKTASYTPNANVSQVDNDLQQKMGEANTQEVALKDAIKMKVSDPVAYYANKPFYSTDEKLVQNDRDIPADTAIQNKITAFGSYYNSLDDIGKASITNPIKDMTDDTYAYYKISADNVLNKTNEDIQYLESLGDNANAEQKKRLTVLYDQRENLQYVKDGIVKNENFLKGLFDSFQQNGYVPYIGGLVTGTIDAIDAFHLLSATRKTENGEELNDAEKRVMSEVKLNEIKQFSTNKDMGYSIGKGLVDSLYLMADYIVAGLTPIPDEVVIAGGKVAKVASKAMSMAIKAGKVTLTSGVPRIAEDVAQYQTPEYQFDWKDNDFDIVGQGDTAGEALIKSVAKEYGNNIIELGLGEAISGTESLVKTGLGKMIGKEIGASSKNEVVKALVESGGWNGFLGEFAEEIAQKYYEEGAIDQKNIKDIKFTPEEIASITASILIMQGVISTAESYGAEGQNSNAQEIADKAEQKIIETINNATDRNDQTNISDSLEWYRGNREELLKDYPNAETDFENKVKELGSTEEIMNYFSDLKGKQGDVFNSANVDNRSDEEASVQTGYTIFFSNPEVTKLYEQGLTDKEIVDKYLKGEIDTKLTDQKIELENKIKESIESKLAVEDLNQQELTKLSGMYSELQEAVVGEKKGRSAIYDDATNKTTYTTTGVGYPAWLPESFRDKATVEKVLDSLVNEVIPVKGTKAYNLYQLILQNSRGEEDFLGYTTARRNESRRYDDIQSMDDIRRNLDILRKDMVKSKELESKPKTYDADILTDYASNSLAKTDEGLKKANNLQGEKVSFKEAESGLANNGKYLKERIVFGKNEAGEIIIKDGRHLLEAYRQLDKAIPQDKVKFEDGVEAVDVNESEGSMKMKKKSNTDVETEFYKAVKDLQTTAYKNLDNEEDANEDLEQEKFDKVYELAKQLGIRVEWNDAEQFYDYFFDGIKDKQTASEVVRDFAKANGIDVTVNPNNTIRLYHGTTAENAENILKEGFDREAGYLSSSLEEEVGGVNGARYYGDSIIQVDVDPRYLMFRVEGEFAFSSNEAISNIQMLEDPTTEEDKYAEGRVNLESYDDRGTKVEVKELRVAEEVVKLVRKYAKKVGEKYVPKGALGAFYLNSKDIRLKGMTDFYVASHEIAHAIDNKLSISIATGNDAVRTELMSAYVDMYPTAKNTDEEKTQLKEGFATLVAEYVKSPATMIEKYPHAVKELLMEGGKYYKDTVGEYINDLTNIVIRYQSLNDLDKFGVRMAKDIPTVPNTLFKNKIEQALNVVQDDLNVIERWTKEQGVFMTKDDYAQMFRFRNQVNAIVENNYSTKEAQKLKGKKGVEDYGRLGKLFGGVLNYVGGKNTDEYWRYNPLTANVEKTLDYNWGTLRARLAIKGLSDQFNYALVARRSYYDYLNKDNYTTEIRDSQKRLAEIDEQLIALDQESKGEITNEMKELRNEKILLETNITDLTEKLKYVNQVIENDDFPRDLSERAYLNSRDLFISEYKMFDELTNQDLLLAVESGKLSKEKYNELKDNKGYAPFKRIVYDEVIGEVSPAEAKNIAKLSGTQISSLKKRTGSTKEILYPLDSAMRNHQEFVRKSMSQISVNTFLTPRTVSMYGDLIKPVDYTMGIENNKEILITMNDGEKSAYAVNPMIKEWIGEYLTPQQTNLLENIQHAYKRMWTAGTTGSYIQFAFTNLPRDFINYTTQTYQKNAFKAVGNLFADTVKVIGGKLKSSKEYEYFTKFLALGGQELTFVRWMEGDYNTFDQKVTGEMNAIKKLGSALSKFGNGLLNLISFPSHVSELVFRATEFIEAKKSGDSDLVALEKARRVTTPFHMKGSYKLQGKHGEVTNLPKVYRAIPFANAQLQGFTWVTSNFINSPKIRQRMIFATALISALGVEELLRAWRNADDDEKQQLRDLTAEDLGRFIFMPNKKTNNMTRMAVAEWAGGISGFINMLVLDTILDKDNTNYRLSDYTTALTTSIPDSWNFLVPMSALLSKDGWKGFTNEVGKNLLSQVPAITKPILAIAGYKTYPDLLPIEADWQKNKLPADRFNEGTSALAKWLLQQKLPFSRERLGDSLGLSPLKLDALLESFFGRAVGYITQKPEAWNLTSSVFRDYYFEYGRRVNDYSVDKERNDQLYTSMKNGSIDLTKDEQMGIYIKKELSKKVEKSIKAYSDAYDSKDLEAISNTRSKVISLIDQYNNDGVPDEVKAYLENPTPDNMKQLIKEQVRQEIGDKDLGKYTKEEKTLAKTIGEDFRQQALLARSEYDYDQLLFGVTTLADKSTKVSEVKTEINDPEKFRAYLTSLRYANMISDDCIKQLLEDKVIDKSLNNWLTTRETNTNF